MTLHARRDGSGPPLLLVHGLGSSTAGWDPVLPLLTPHRTCIRVDLPGHGRSPRDTDSGTFAGQARALSQFVHDEGLAGVGMAGSSLGGRLVLELARTGLSGPVVALDPGGFWEGWERAYLRTTLKSAVWMLRSMTGAIPALAHALPARSLMLGLLSAQPWKLDGDIAERELKSYAACPVFDELVEALAAAPMQAGPAADGAGPVTIGWGRHDRLTLTVQATRAQAAFPDARLHWFEASGHFPIWDQPDEAARLILEGTGP